LSLVTPRKGYKSVPWLFGKEIEIPDEWEVKSVDCLGEIVTGTTPSTTIIENYGSEFLWATPSDLISTKNVVVTETKLSKKGFEQVRKLPKHSIMMTCIGMIGRTGLTSEEMSTNQQINSIITKNVNFEFVYYSLTFNQERISNSANQSVVQIINKKDFGKIKIIIPKNISEQQKIATILSNVDNLIESTGKVITHSKKVKTGLMQKLLTRGIGHTKFKKVKWLFGKIIEIPEEWEIKEIIDVGQNFGDAPFGSMLKTVDFTEKGIPIARGINIKNNQFKWIHPLYTSKEKFDSLERSHCHEGDIGFQKIGNSIGDIAIMPKIEGHDVYLLSTNMMKMSVNPNIILTDYVFYYFSQNRVRDFIKLNSNGSAKPIFNFTTMKKFKIILPSLPEQQKIASILSNVDIQITSQTQYKEKLERLKKSLMQKLLTGEIRV
jgi:type I restriction enzyme, S subunit